MATVFCDTGGVVLVDFLEKGRTITGKYYTDLLRQLGDKIKEKRREMLTNGVLLHQDNAPAHKSALAMAAAHQCGFQLVEHPLYFPNLAPSDT